MKAALCFFLCISMGIAAEAPFKFTDPKPHSYQQTARASELDARCKPYNEVDNIFVSRLEKEGKPTDLQYASVDTRVSPRGQLVLWLMAHNQVHADLINSYGLHYIQVWYAREWFSKLNTEPADDLQHLGNIRLEATTGFDASKAIDIPIADSMQEHAYQYVKSLSKTNPQGRWGIFLSEDGTTLNWDKVIVAGASHGATSAARFAIHQKVARVVMHCGPRDNLDDWQALPSATPKNRFFGYSHVLDSGWTADHYERSWLLLGLNKFGPIVNTDKAKPPYGHTRRLISDALLNGTPKEQADRAHGYVTPSKGSPRDAKGKFLQDGVWRYLYTSSVDEFGKTVAAENDVRMEQRKK